MQTVYSSTVVPVETDDGAAALAEGVPVNSSDQPGDGSGAGIISAGESAVIVFDVQVSFDALFGDIIRNQGSIASSEIPLEMTDADGVPSNGDQPTEVVVGEAQLLSISKEAVVPGGIALPGAQIEYVIRVENIGGVPVTNVVVIDDLNSLLGTLVDYIADSGRLNGSQTGVSYADGQLGVDYGSLFGDLPPGEGFIVRFRVQIVSSAAIGATITNIGTVQYNTPTQTISDEVSIDVGGTPGSAIINGHVWHDASLDKILDDTVESRLSDWTVALYQDNVLLTTTTTDDSGAYSFSGLPPTTESLRIYEIRFTAPGAGAQTAALGYADSPFDNGLQQISLISVASGDNLQDLNLPIWPNGVVYNTVTRTPMAGVALTLLNAAESAVLPEQCFDDPKQQYQVTASDGFYKFDLNFSHDACPAGGAYMVEVYYPGAITPSQIIPPVNGLADAPFSVPECPGSAFDAIPATAYCEAAASAQAPPLSMPPRTTGTMYYLHFILDEDGVSGDNQTRNQIFNNAIPVDPVLDGVVAITKSVSVTNVHKGDLVPYTITVANTMAAPLYDVSIVDLLPAGFKYISNSARMNGESIEPQLEGRQLVWSDRVLQVNETYTLQFLLVVGSGVSEGEYVNRAYVVNSATGQALSGQASATVQVVPDPDFDCTDIIGKVFDDRDFDGYQDENEKGPWRCPAGNRARSDRDDR